MKLSTRAKLFIFSAAILGLVVLRVVTTPSTGGKFDKEEWNNMILHVQVTDAKENRKRGGSFESTSFEGRDAYGTAVRFESVDSQWQVRSAGPDKIFNNDDDLIRKEESQ